jgi:aminoglycoside phosphotransferase (APT) family kinase protein
MTVVQRTTRQAHEVQRGLQQWFTRTLETPAAVVDLQLPDANGMSSDTVLFDLVADGRVERLVARIAPLPSVVPVFERYDLEAQARVMRVVRERTSVPVPEVLWVEPDSASLGTPFFVMRRVDGRIPPDVMPYNFGSWVTEATAEQRRRLQDSTVAVIAGVHTIPGADGADGGDGGDGMSALRRHVDAQRAFYEWGREGDRLRVVERAFEWLDAHWPAHEGPTVQSWGDARIGNVMYESDGFEPVAVLDWEMAALAPPEVDVAWCCFLHEFFEDIADQMGLEGLPDFLRIDDVAATYEAVTGYAPRDLDWYRVYAALRHAVVMSRTERRRIAFGEVGRPDDPDDLVMHRNLLESMLR